MRSGDQAVDEHIRLRAYYLWEASGRPAGRDEEVWHRACEMTTVDKSVPISKTQSKGKKATRPTQPRRARLRLASPPNPTAIYSPPG